MQNKLDVENTDMIAETNLAEVDNSAEPQKEQVCEVELMKIRKHNDTQGTSYTNTAEACTIEKNKAKEAHHKRHHKTKKEKLRKADRQAESEQQSNKPKRSKSKSQGKKRDVAKIKFRAPLKRRVLYALIALTFAFVILLIAAILCAILKMERMDVKEKLRATVENGEIAKQWTEWVQNYFFDTFVVSKGLRGFVLGSLQSIPDVNSTVEDRLRGQYFEQFDRMASYFNSTVEYVDLILIAPGGVISQTFPNISALRGFDLFNLPSLPHHVPGPRDIVNRGETLMVGPNYTTFADWLEPKWIFVIEAPVFNVSDITTHAWSNFWGFAYVLVDVMKMIHVEEITNYIAEYPDVEYLWFSSYDDGINVPIAASFNADHA